MVEKRGLMKMFVAAAVDRRVAGREVSRGARRAVRDISPQRRSGGRSAGGGSGVWRPHSERRIAEERGDGSVSCVKALQVLTASIPIHNHKKDDNSPAVVKG